MEKICACLEMGNGNQPLLFKSWVNQEAILSKQVMDACTKETEVSYWKPTDEDQTIEISDDDGEAEIINIKIEDESYMTNQEEQQENNTEVRKDQEEYRVDLNNLKIMKLFRRGM